MLGEAEAAPYDNEPHSTYGLRSSHGRRDSHTSSANDRAVELSKKACNYSQYPDTVWEAPRLPCTLSSGSNDSAGTTATDGGGCAYFHALPEPAEVTTASKVVSLPLPPSPASAGPNHCRLKMKAALGLESVACL